MYNLPGGLVLKVSELIKKLKDAGIKK